MKINKKESLRFTKIDDHAKTWELIIQIATEAKREEREACLTWFEGIDDIKLSEAWLSIISKEMALKLIKGFVHKYASEYRRRDLVKTEIL